jgi:hypothetical protein
MNYHVAAFPEELVHFFVYSHTDPGDLVLDPFLGSGTTLKVARVCGRRGVGYEINPGYADLVAERIREQWTPSSFEEIDVIASSTADPDDRRSRRRPRFDYRRGAEPATIDAAAGPATIDAAAGPATAEAASTAGEFDGAADPADVAATPPAGSSGSQG